MQLMIYLDVKEEKITRVLNYESADLIEYDQQLPGDFLNTFSLSIPKYIWDGEAIILNKEYHPPADWNGFLDAMSNSTISVKIARSSLAILLFARVQRLAENHTQWGGSSDPLISSWNNSEIDLSEAEATTLNSIAAAKNLPVRLINGVLTEVSFTA